MVLEIGYVTDVEGNLDYFNRWVAQSRVLRYDADGKRLEFVHDGAYFVYGGDAVDRGNGGERFVRLLVDLKLRYPSRVALIVGNRDLNKLRLTAELADSDMKRPLEAIKKPHWDDHASSLHNHLHLEASRRGTTVASLNTKPERLKYLYKHTLGCPNTFELRREELAILRGTQKEQVTDDEVVAACVADVMPGGALRQYMENAHVACLIGNTLFVHGAVDRKSMRMVPADKCRFERPKNQDFVSELCETPQQWIDALNAFLRRGLEDHLQRPEWDEARQTRGGESLMAIQNRTAMWGMSVISNCYSDGGNITSGIANQIRTEAEAKADAGKPIALEGVCSDPRDEVWAEWLTTHGVRRVIVGHKPSGDSPAVLSSRYHGVEIISGDTSYSDPGAKDSRGVAVAGIMLRGESLDEMQTVIFGTLHDGAEHEATLPFLGGERDGMDGDPYVGVELPGGWWVKAKLKAPPERYLCCKGQGRNVEYRCVPTEGISSGDLHLPALDNLSPQPLADDDALKESSIHSTIVEKMCTCNLF
ncbi:hypothetical protein AB1Y20_007005 [Prymnesium parvum]|uniref:Calcineurin-like phosphoesterase domain-containing protein n=1 Tax=Prymnesium parvum TaxID=97485 RepID=A0AB34J1Z8_PRYPA|mmetsp:Transcript_34805/g.79611  ORF Transcript_34805/g.79611 Transcript_34805/m.79611 type:complete len:533 (-) Transcript_34805:215-1813(-)